MRLLLDTQILLRMAAEPETLSNKAVALLQDSSNVLAFSVVGIWEVAIKRALNRPDFQAEPRALRAHLLAEGCVEIAMTGDHALAVRDLASIHRDPFDRVLIAQASVENMTLLTTDAVIARYPGDIVLV